MGWDEDLLKLEVRDVQTSGYDLALTGFNTKELDDLLLAEIQPEDAVPPLPALIVPMLLASPSVRLLVCDPHFLDYTRIFGQLIARHATQLRCRTASYRETQLLQPAGSDFDIGEHDVEAGGAELSGARPQVFRCVRRAAQRSEGEGRRSPGRRHAARRRARRDPAASRPGPRPSRTAHTA